MTTTIDRTNYQDLTDDDEWTYADVLAERAAQAAADEIAERSVDEFILEMKTEAMYS